MKLSEKYRKEADYYNANIKEWEPKGERYLKLLQNLEAAAGKGQYKYTERNPTITKDARQRLEEEGFKVRVDWVEEEFLKTVDPDTYETISVQYMEITW